jgi:two-component system, cell cycle response regulator DivK
MAGELILIVDDTPVNLKLTRLLLVSEGYEVLTATTAEEALDLLAEHRPRLVLTDIQLPGIDGLELTRRLKRDPAMQGVLVVALTAFAMKGDEEKAFEAGCDGYITKPIDTRTLGLRLREYLKNDSVELAGAGGSPDLAELQERFLEEARGQVAQWLKNLDGPFHASEAAGVVHQWAGASGLLGFREIARLIGELLAVLRERPVDNSQLRELLTGLLSALRVPH